MELNRKALIICTLNYYFHKTFITNSEKKKKKVRFDGLVDWPMMRGLQQHVTEGWITCQRKKALLFFLGKKVEEQCLERRFSVILYFLSDAHKQSYIGHEIFRNT